MKQLITLTMMACTLTIAMPAAARKCDALTIKLTAKPGYVCQPAGKRWPLPAHLAITGYWKKLRTIRSGETTSYTVGKRLSPISTIWVTRQKVRIEFPMTFNCHPIDSTNKDDTKKITITSKQAKRFKLSAGAISGTMTPANTETTYTTTPGVCTGNSKHAGMISWVLG